jgi:hypothetical protein
MPLLCKAKLSSAGDSGAHFSVAKIDKALGMVVVVAITFIGHVVVRCDTKGFPARTGIGIPSANRVVCVHSYCHIAM